MKGDIVTGNMGIYERLFYGNSGTIITIIAKFNSGFEVPTEWKVVSYKDGITKYEIGYIKINETKHKIHLIELQSVDVKHTPDLESIK